jgi:hypothetical protein
MFNKYEQQKLFNDIKLIAKAIHIARDENNSVNRTYACGLVEDLLNNLYNNINEMTEGNILPVEYDGSKKLTGDLNDL